MAQVRRSVTIGFVATAMLGVAIWMFGVSRGREGRLRVSEEQREA